VFNHPATYIPGRLPADWPHQLWPDKDAEADQSLDSFPLPLTTTMFSTKGKKSKPVQENHENHEKEPEKHNGESPESTTVDEKTAASNDPPVSFFRLFRFATKLEISLNCIGILCAIAAGSAQVCLCSLLAR
jgi:hypothetical protein